MIGKRFVAGPVMTALIILMIDYFTRAQLAWFTPTLALAFAALALNTIVAGLWSNMISATLIIAYSLYASPFDLSRTIQIATAALLIAVVSGIVKREARLAHQARQKAELVDLITNGHFDKLLEALKQIRQLKSALYQVDKELSGLYDLAIQIEDRLGNSAANVVGWRRLRDEIRQIKADFGAQAEGDFDES